MQILDKTLMTRNNISNFISTVYLESALSSNMITGCGLKQLIACELWPFTSPFIQYDNWMWIETLQMLVKRAQTLAFIQLNNWLRIETHLTPGALFCFASFIQYINWMWIETLAKDV